MRTLALLMLLFGLSTAAHAGGTSVPVRYLDLTPAGPGRYSLTFETLSTEEYEAVPLPRNSTVVVELRFNEGWYRTYRPHLTRERFEEAIGLLRKHTTAKRTDRFGMLGGGLCPVSGQPTRFQSDAVEVAEEEHPGGKTLAVVYSLCNWR